jgi:hypothetical protein
VVLGQMVRAEPKAIVELGQLEPLRQLLGRRAAVVVDVIEDSETQAAIIYDRRSCAPRS